MKRDKTKDIILKNNFPSKKRIEKAFEENDSLFLDSVNSYYEIDIIKHYNIESKDSKDFIEELKRLEKEKHSKERKKTCDIMSLSISTRSESNISFPNGLIRSSSSFIYKILSFIIKNNIDNLRKITREEKR